MRDCKITWKVRLLEEWLPNWKASVPQRWLKKWENGVPETWVEKFQQTVPEGWAGKLRDTRDAIFDACDQSRDDYHEKLKENKKSEGKSEPLKKKKKSEGKSKQNEDSNLLDETYNTIIRDFKKRYGWVKQHLTGRQTWKPRAAPNQKREKSENPVLGWEDFITKLIEILLEKEPQIMNRLENNDPKWDTEYVYFLIKLQMNILDNFISSDYKAELHGRNQPFPEERDFIDDSFEKLLNGKRQWNPKKSPDSKDDAIEELLNGKRQWNPKKSPYSKLPIEATVSSLVSHANKKEEKVRENDADCKHKLGGLISLSSQKMGEVEDESGYETAAFAAIFDNEVDDELNSISSPGSDHSHEFLQYEHMTHGDEQRVSDDAEDSELRQQIYKVVHNDPELTYLVEYLLEHEPPYNPTSQRFLFKTQEIANALGCSVTKVNNLKRKLERRLTPIFFDKVRRLILNNVNDNPKLTSMVNFLFDKKLYDPKSKAFIFKPQKIANGLRWTVPEVNSLKKELQRKLKQTEIKGHFFVEKERSVVWQRVHDNRQLILIVVFLFHNDCYAPESKTFIFDPEKLAKYLRRTVSEVNNLKEELQNRLETLHINVVEPELA